MTQGMNYELSFNDEQAMIMKTAREFCRKQSPISAVREWVETEELEPLSVKGIEGKVQAYKLLSIKDRRYGGDR